MLPHDWNHQNQVSLKVFWWTAEKHNHGSEVKNRFYTFAPVWSDYLPAPSPTVMVYDRYVIFFNVGCSYMYIWPQNKNYLVPVTCISPKLPLYCNVGGAITGVEPSGSGNSQRFFVKCPKTEIWWRTDSTLSSQFQGNLNLYGYILADSSYWPHHDSRMWDEVIFNVEYSMAITKNCSVHVTAVMLTLVFQQSSLFIAVRKVLL